MYKRQVHIRFALLVVEGLGEVISGAALVDIAVMGEVHPAGTGKMANPPRHVDIHLGEAALTEGQPVGRRIDQVKQALEVLGAGHDPTEATNRRARRIVGVHGHFDPRLLRHRHHHILKHYQRKLPQYYPNLEDQ